MSSNGTAVPTPVDPLMYYITIIQCAICSSGLFLNGFLLYTIFRNKELRATSCTIFLMCLASFDWLNEFALAILPTFLTVTGTTIPLLTCLFMTFYGNYVFSNMVIMLFTISLDRLASVIVPIKYKFLTRRHKWKYVLSVVLLPAIGLVPFTLYQYYKTCMAQPNLQVYCQPNDIVGTDGQNFGNSINVWSKVCTFIVYFCIFLLFKCKVVKISDDQVERRIAKSIFVLMAITLLFALPGPLFVQYVLPTLKIQNVNINNYIYRGGLLLPKISQACNGPVLYSCSADYRTAIRKEWANFFGPNSNVLNTASATQQQQTLQKQNVTGPFRGNRIAPSR